MTSPTQGSVSRQRAWQLRKHALGLCQQCGKPKDGGSKALCRACYARHNAYQRKRRSCKSLYACGNCGQRGHNRRTCTEVA